MEQAHSGPPKHNLPAQLTTLVGRDADIVEVKRLLESHRLVTLTGAGGVGKTQLALSVASELAGAGSLPDGVWLVELGGLADPKLVPQAIARALRAHEQTARSVEDTLVDALTDRQVLLLIDNCEHVIDACARLIGQLLRTLRGVRVLATSREPLGIPGEIAWRVPSLGVPPNGISSLEALAEYPSVQLLVDRASAAVNGFALASRNAAAVASVCQRLEGIPLALELAAARLAVLTPEQVAERLGDVFRLLATGSRTADPRQQTLWATVDWSYELLSEPERMLFRRCSVFVGGWALETAEQVCTDDVLRSSDVLDLTAQLVAKSLIIAEEHGAAERYRMLEPIQQFAARQLADRDETAAVRTRHLNWLVDLSERAEVGLWGPEQVRWLERLEAEHENIQAGLEWSHTSGHFGEMLRLTVALARFWDVRGYLTEGFGWLAAALEATPSHQTKPRAQALVRAGYLAVLRGDRHAADVYLPRALSLAQQLGDEETIGAAFLVMGMSARARGDYQQAALDFEQSLEMSRRAEHRPGVYTSLYLLASAARFSGDHARAVALHEESLDLKRQQGDLWGVAASLFSLGTLARILGHDQRGGDLYRESLTLRRELGDRMGICVCLEALAGLAVEPGHAAVLVGAAERLRDAIGPGGHATVRTDELLETLRSALGPEELTESLARGRSLGTAQAIELALTHDVTNDAAPAVREPQPVEPAYPADRENFRALVEDALRHLNDAPTLRTHALLRRLPAIISQDVPASEAGTLLRGELLQAIERLRPNSPPPPPGTSTGAGAWLHYLVLQESYVADRGNTQIMQRYYLGEGTFYRARRRAVDAVAQDLAQRGGAV